MGNPFIKSWIQRLNKGMKYRIRTSVGIVIICLISLCPYLLLLYYQKNIYLTTLLRKWPDFVVNFLGILIGGLAAFFIAMYQLHKQRNEAIRKDNELLDLLFDRVKQELNDDSQIVKQPFNILNESEHARVDLWAWAVTIINSLSVVAFNNLIKSDTQKYLPTEKVGLLYAAYQHIIGLSNMVRQAQAAHDFHYGYSGNKEAADLQLNNIRTFCKTILTYLQKTIERL